MYAPRLIRHADGRVVLDRLAPAFVHVLHELPDLLGPDQPDEVKDRLYQHATEDEEHKKEWERFVHPDLFALVASAREVVLEDLGGFRPDEDPEHAGTWRLEIEGKHVPAWISGLNVARLTLGARHEIEEGDMAEEFVPDDWDEKDVAVAKIHLLAWLQQLLIEDQHPTPEDYRDRYFGETEDEDDDGEDSPPGFFDPDFGDDPESGR